MTDEVVQKIGDAIGKSLLQDVERTRRQLEELRAEVERLEARIADVERTRLSIAATELMVNMGGVMRRYRLID